MSFTDNPLPLVSAFTEDELLRAYALRNQSVFFLFDCRHYDNIKPIHLAVTGNFHDWELSDYPGPNHLKQISPHVWALEYDNFKSRIGLNEHSEFKFIADVESGTETLSGVWMSSPTGAPNSKHGNSTFLSYVRPLKMEVEIRRERALWVKFEETERLTDKTKYRLTDAAGHEMQIETVLPNTASEVLITPVKYLDVNRLYYLEVPEIGLKTHCAYDGWFRELYSNKELGANISADKEYTVFRIFSPRAQALKLYLYTNEKDEFPLSVTEMNRDAEGVWETLIHQNLHGFYYDFTAHGADEPGNFFYETVPIHISDPYARVIAGSWGRSRVWEKTKPAKLLKNGIPKPEDIIAYEVHVQDFTDLLPVPDEMKGTFAAMSAPGLRNSAGAKIGLDYLLDLGINVLHLMPVQQYLRYPDAEWKDAFADDPLMQKLGVAEQNYQWGYRTSHALAIESEYRHKNTEHGAQNSQLGDLVEVFHQNNIAVIVDIVPNHTAENMDDNYFYFHFNVLDKIYYYRTKNLKHIGDYGNEVKTENRPMVQRWLIDQCKSLIEEIGIDGFRIDLAGQIDKQSLLKLREEVGPEIIIYGEPWIDSRDPDYEANPDWNWYKYDNPIMFFQDEARNALKGPTDIPHDKFRDRGYAGGNSHLRDAVKTALENSYGDEHRPTDGISYLDVHDNWALADRFAARDWDGRFGVDEDRFKIAAVLLYTSAGPIVTHGGTEMMRSKGLASETGLIKTTKKGTSTHIHGKRDTYNLRTPNLFLWENAGQNKNIEAGIHCNYDEMYRFWRGLNRLRLSDYGKVFRQAERLPAGYYRWLEPHDSNLLGYFVNETVLVLINIGEQSGFFDNVSFPAGRWELAADNQSVDFEEFEKGKYDYSEISGPDFRQISLPPVSLRIWVNRNKASVED